MEAAIGQGQKSAVSNASEWQESYRPLPFLFFGLLMVWTVLAGIWILNTWSKRQWQTGNLQWMLTAVPVLKALVLGLSFTFWYSCLNLSTCSFWVAFGVFVTRIFFETACFIAFLLISHGYCIMHEQLSVSERRSIAGLASLLYLTLTGYKAAVPQFAVMVGAIYSLLLYVIFLHTSKNLTILREQLQHIQDDGVQIMHSAVHTKYNMFKKFQGAMLLIVIAEVLIHAKADGVANEYWVRLLIRELTEIGIFFYIGWTFRSREVTPFFTIIPTLYSPDQRTLPPIYSIEINQNEFNNLDFKEWHIGVPTSASKGDNAKPMLVIVRNPGRWSHDEATARASKNQFDKHPRRDTAAGGGATDFSLTNCNQTSMRASSSACDTAMARSSSSSRRVNSSRCFFSKFLKQQTQKIPVKSHLYQHHDVCDRELILTNRDLQEEGNDITVVSSSLLLKGSIHYESLLSHLV